MDATTKRISQAFYDKLLSAFRLCPGNYSRAAKRSGCDVRTAKRAWLRGWVKQGTDRYDWARPIRDVLAVEKLNAADEARTAQERAKLAAEKERERKRLEQEKVIEEEQQMLRAARGDVLSVLGMALELVPVMREFSAILKESVAKDSSGKRVKDISPATAMNILTRHAMIVQKGVGATEAIIQLSRLDRGASTVNVAAVREDPAEQLTYKDALEELEALQDVLQGARAVELLARAGKAAPTLPGSTRARVVPGVGGTELVVPARQEQSAVPKSAASMPRDGAARGGRRSLVGGRAGGSGGPSNLAG